MVEAVDGQEALVKALTYEPDLIILDVHMTKLNGSTVATQLRKFEGFQRTPIIALTAAVSESMPDQIAQAGFTGYLPKPIGPTRLRRFIADVLSRY